MSDTSPLIDPVSASTDAISEIANRLVDRLAGYGPVAVAFSGGVDSAVVAKAAVLALGDRCVAVTAVSPSLAESDRKLAVQTARELSIRHVEFSTNEFDRVEYRANAGNRCFYCKDTLYSLTAARLQQLQVGGIVNGANVDDLGDHRPGMMAAREHHVRSPLIEEGIDKATVRALARYWQLDVAEKPASPCLASRIAYGVEVTAERVARVEKAEAFLRDLVGNVELRVRCEPNEIARIEIPLDQLHRLTTPDCRGQVTTCLRSLGFRAVTLDLDGFRSGNLNDALPLVQLQTGRVENREA